MRFQYMIVFSFSVYSSVSFAEIPEGYRQVASSPKGSIFYMAPSDISNQSEYYPKIWVHEEASGNKGVKYNFAKVLYVFDCRKKTMKFVDVIEYNSDGSVLNMFSNDTYAAPQNIVPDSIGEGIFVQACPNP
ncbi:MAG: surface-adhesin E family protein [Polymorphobacter sp.]